ncbi:F0F1 ATP synthase subunit B [Limibacillus sp. MBR-115]|jgi:F-type H+-transporting ATPase subunit b|uniref:F0F1 ATP synthase subunit B family protein n=1 Tax=Limibacillus sp. MBR-115 TaxID=3156465 RepID=UPI003397BAA7
MFSSPEFWVAAALVIFIGLAVWKGMRPLLDSLDQRSEKIRNELDEARSLREEAQALLADYKRKQRDALAEAEQIVDHAKQEAQRLAKKAEADLKEQLARREQQALDKIAQAEQHALREVRDQAVDLAIAATAKLVESKLTDKDAGKLVDDSIAGLGSKLN